MGRSTRRRFLVTASTIAGSLAVARRFGLAESPPIESGDLKLWYTKPASQWVDALPIGNGRLGAMVFGGGAIDPIDPKDPKADHAAGPVPTDPAKETLQLNEDTLWSGLPVDGNNLDAKNYLPAMRKAVLGAEGLSPRRPTLPEDARPVCRGISAHRQPACGLRLTPAR